MIGLVGGAGGGAPIGPPAAGGIDASDGGGALGQAESGVAGGGAAGGCAPGQAGSAGAGSAGVGSAGVGSLGEPPGDHAIVG
jgi:hypothetical protein